MSLFGYTVEEIETIVLGTDEEAACIWIPSRADHWAMSEGFPDFDTMLDITGLTHEELFSCIPADFE